MASNDELKHLGFVEEAAVKILAILSTLYGLKKEHEYNFLKPFCEFVETKIIFVMGPVSEKITNMSYQILKFVDGKFDIYAPTFIVNLVDKFNSYIIELGLSGTITSVTETVINQVQEAGATIVQKGSESATQVIETVTTVVGGIPIIGDTAQSIITTQTDALGQIITTTTTTVKENGIIGAISSAANSVVSGVAETGSSIIQKGTDAVSQAVDTTTSVVGSIPIIGESAQSIITTQTDAVGQMITTTTTSVKENGIIGAITSAGSSIIQTGTDSVNQVLDTTTSVIGSIPIIGGITTSITTDTDVDTQEADTTTSPPKKSGGFFGSMISAAGNVVTGTANTVKKTVDGTTSAVSSIPVVGNIISAPKLFF